MDINDFKKQSEKSYGIALAKQNALEKAKSKMIMAYEGHLFLANAETINLVKTLSELHTSPFYILDTNDNPVEIADPKIILSPTTFAKEVTDEDNKIANAEIKPKKIFVSFILFPLLIN